MPPDGSGVSAQSLIDSIPDYVLVVDSQHRIVMANKAVAGVAAVDVCGIIGGYCPTLLHGSPGPVPYCPLELAAAKHGPAEVETCHTPSGRWAKSVAYPISTQDGSELFLHMLVDIDALKQAEAALAQRSTDLKAMGDSIIGILSAIVEMRCPYTAGHQQRVSVLAIAIARAMSWPEDRITGLAVAAALHDLGKIAVPTEILNRPGKLTDLEMALIRGHSEIGYQILVNVPFPWPVATAVRQHHERMNGSGYPQGLQGEAIIPEARVVAVADVVEAMSSYRPYRDKLSADEVRTELVQNRAILYDAAVVDAYLRIWESGCGVEADWVPPAQSRGRTEGTIGATLRTQRSEPRRRRKEIA